MIIRPYEGARHMINRAPNAPPRLIMNHCPYRPLKNEAA